MKEIVIQDDAFEKETVGTIFEDYYVYLAMLIFCCFENRTYTKDALFRELRRINSEIKKKDMPSILNPLLNKKYIGTKGNKIEHYFPKEEGIKAFKDVYDRLLEKSGYSEKTLRPRKSYIQEIHECPEYGADFWSLVE